MTVDEARDFVATLVKRHGSAERVAQLLKGAAAARTVRRHADGTRKPSAALLAKYVALDTKTTAPPVEGGPDSGLPSPPVDAGSSFDGSAPTLQHVIALAARADEVLRMALSDPSASHRDRAGAVHALSRCLRDLSSLRGELDPTEATIYRSAAWSRCLTMIETVLRAYPEAAQAVSAAIAAVATDGDP